MRLQTLALLPVVLSCAPLLGCAAPLGRSVASLQPAPADWPVDFSAIRRPTGVASDYHCPVYLTSQNTGATLILRLEIRKVEQSTDIEFAQRQYSLFGDYQMHPSGALGIKVDQRVRLDCRTGQVLGIGREQADDVLRRFQFR